MAIFNEGFFEYNGISFDAYGKSSVNATPIFDEANRMVKYVEIQFKHRGIVTPNLAFLQTSTDDLIDQIRRNLTRNGGYLLYTGKGFGDFQVNVGTLWDVNYGPHPKLMTFVPIGSKMACYVDWECTTRVPQCPEGDQILTNGIVELTYSVNWTMDLDGIHVVTTTGKIEIAKNFGPNAPNATRTADDFWTQIYIPQQPGWQRDQRTKHLSHDRRTLTFTFQDRELPVPLPNGQTRAKIKHSVKNMDQGFVRFAHHVTAVFSTDRSVSRFTSFRNFIICVNNIINNIKTNRPTVAILPMQLECVEEILGLEDHYSFSFSVIGTNRNFFIRTSGLWQLIPNTDHVSWIASIVNSSGAPRGLLGNDVKYDIRKDILVDLCTRERVIESPGNQPSTNTEQQPKPKPLVSPDNSNLDEDQHLQEFYSIERYKPEDDLSNWLFWDMELVDIEKNHVVRHKPLYGTTQQTEFNADIEKPNSIINLPKTSITPHSELNVEADAEDLFQKINTPSCFVLLRGRAVRQGYRIPVPRLIKYGDAVITQVSCVAPEKTLGPSLGIPIYERRWEILYMLSRPQLESPNVIKPYPGLDDEDYEDAK